MFGTQIYNKVYRVTVMSGKSIVGLIVCYSTLSIRIEFSTILCSHFKVQNIRMYMFNANIWYLSVYVIYFLSVHY